ncbi:MAG TPA: flagellar brake protein [Burkholderiaceae bacterium]|nr:flagellar brake protein [Burkholderiaceae bacterium]
MSLTTPFPEPDSPELERFAIYSRSEIANLLRQLRDRQVLVTLYYDQAAGFTVSNVLDVNEGFEELILDRTSDAPAQKAIYASKQLVVVAFLDNVKLQFSVGTAESVDHHGRPAFRVRLPQQLLRMQRRNSYRRQPPAIRPATCLIPSPRNKGQYESVRVLDLSVGGLALFVHPAQFDLPTDQDLENCYLDLPDVGQITVTLRVRYVDAESSRNGVRRCGCEFVDLSESAARMLQRYMNKLDAPTRPRSAPPDEEAA